MVTCTIIFPACSDLDIDPTVVTKTSDHEGDVWNDAVDMLKNAVGAPNCAGST